MSADYKDLKIIVEKSKIIHVLKNKKFQNTEQYKNRKLYRRYIFLKNSNNLKKKINLNDLEFLRYNGKISVEKLEKIIKNKKKI